MTPIRKPAQSHGLRAARGFLAVALAFGATAATAQQVYRHTDGAGHVSFTDRPDVPIIARELAPEAAAPADGISGRSAKFAVRSNAIDRREAERRLAQAQRELARGPDMQQGIPPSAEKQPGDRRRARASTLQRNVDAARARAQEVNAPAFPAEAAFREKNGV